LRTTAEAAAAVAIVGERIGAHRRLTGQRRGRCRRRAIRWFSCGGRPRWFLTGDLRDQISDVAHRHPVIEAFRPDVRFSTGDAGGEALTELRWCVRAGLFAVDDDVPDRSLLVERGTGRGRGCSGGALLIAAHYDRFAATLAADLEHLARDAIIRDRVL